jgi:hypothetical protein
MRFMDKFLYKARAMGLKHRGVKVVYLLASADRPLMARLLLDEGFGLTTPADSARERLMMLAHADALAAGEDWSQTLEGVALVTAAVAMGMPVVGARTLRRPFCFSLSVKAGKQAERTMMTREDIPALLSADALRRLLGAAEEVGAAALKTGLPPALRIGAFNLLRAGEDARVECRQIEQ